MDEQLSFDVPGEVSRAPEFLTIAGAAERVRCCERTIRRAIDSGALRAGRIHAIDGKRGGSVALRGRRPTSSVRGCSRRTGRGVACRDCRAELTRPMYRAYETDRVRPIPGRKAQRDHRNLVKQCACAHVPP